MRERLRWRKCAIHLVPAVRGLNGCLRLAPKTVNDSLCNCLEAVQTDVRRMGGFLSKPNEYPYRQAASTMNRSQTL
uniref:Secreted protein n=1 Tax=Panagrellus redivivus TaxID=6233 RepID=A0A7E4VEG4_PANRE